MEINEQMTVVELRAIAKENGIKLPSGLDKKGIIEKLAALDTKLTEEPAAVTEPVQRPIRKASIIADDDEETESTPSVFPMNRVFQNAPVVPAATARTSGSSLANISSKAPAFTMEGARAWHNPRSYNPAPPAQSYARTQWSTKPVFPQGSPFAANPGTVSSNEGQQAQSSSPAPYRPARVSADSADDAPKGPVQPSRYTSPYPKEMTLVESQEDFAGQERANNPIPEPAEPALTPETLLSAQCKDGEGILEISENGDGYLRVDNFLPGKNDIYVSYQQIHRYKLRKGDFVSGKIRSTDRFPLMLYIENVNGIPVDSITDRNTFDSLTPLYPKKKINFSERANLPAEARIIDLLSPIGFGQRALVIAPEHCGKTSFLVHLYRAIRLAEPDAQIVYVSLDETPENLALVKQQIGKDLASLSCDQSFENMVKLSELVIENAIRAAEAKKNAIIILDSMTKLANAYSAVSPAASRTLANGLTAFSFNGVKRFFGSARNLKEGGSVTVITAVDAETALADDLSVYANMILSLDKDTAAKKVFPAIDLSSMSSKKFDLLMSAEEIQCKEKLNDYLKKCPNNEGIQQMQFMFGKAPTNAELTSKIGDWLALLGN